MIQFPTQLDNLNNPQEADKQNSPLHTDQHANANDAIEALEEKVGIDNSADENSLDYKIAQLESTRELTSNKENTTLDTSTTKYPTNRLVKEYADGKVTANAGIIGATKTKITYDAKGLITAGEDATTADIAESTNQRYVTDANLTAIETIGDKAPLDSPTFTGTVETPAIKITTGAGANKVLTSDADGNATWETSTAGGTSLWTAIAGTRASNTTITVAGDQTAIFKKGMIVRWQESGVDKVGMVSIPSTYSSPNTTITIIGDTCASIDTDTFKYSVILGAEKKPFVIAGTIGAVATNVANAWYADKPYRIIGAELSVGDYGTTNNTTIDLNKNGTSMFTTKPTLASTVAFATTPFTADTATSLALGDKVTMDIDAIQTTPATDLYSYLLVFETRFLTLS